MKDYEIDKLEQDVKEIYGAIPDLSSLAPEIFAEVTLAVASYHFITSFCFVRGCAAAGSVTFRATDVGGGAIGNRTMTRGWPRSIFLTRVLLCLLSTREAQLTMVVLPSRRRLHLCWSLVIQCCVLAKQALC